MKKITRLTERDLTRIVRRVINEAPTMSQGISLDELSNKVVQLGGGKTPTNKITLSSSGVGNVYVHFVENGVNNTYYIEC
jgi:hypothetical protein